MAVVLIPQDRIDCSILFLEPAPLVTARRKLNSAAVHGAFVIAGLIALATRSWLAFVVSAVLMLATAAYDGAIRLTARRREKRP